MTAILVLCLLAVGCAGIGESSQSDARIAKGDDIVKTIQLPEISPEEAGVLFKGDVDWNLARERGLTNERSFTEAYLRSEVAYMALFNELLVSEYGFGDYQQMLDEHPWEYPKGDTDKAIVANGSFGRNNVYIRSTAYVERLSEGDSALLSGAIEDGQLFVTEGLLQMVADTYPAVLEVRAEGFSTPFDVLYQDGVFTSQIAPNNSIVFIVSYQPEYDDEGDVVDDEVEAAKNSQASLLQELMESEMSEKLGCPVSVFVER